MISNFKFRIFESKLSFFNSAILSNLMSNSPILIPQSFFPHTICTFMVADLNTSQRRIREVGGRGGGGVPPFFPITCFFCNHFGKLQTVLFKVELIINNAPLTYVYPNAIETCLIPNHFLFGK